MSTLKDLFGSEFHENGKQITYDSILELAELLQYISVKVCDKVNIIIDGKVIETPKDVFVKEVCNELNSGKTLVSSIRYTVFNKIRISNFNNLITNN